MIVPVKHWATYALLGLARAHREPRQETAEKTHEYRVGLLEFFEKLLTVNTDIIIRGLDE